jgi:hypothetical protein
VVRGAARPPHSFRGRRSCEENGEYTQHDAYAQHDAEFALLPDSVNEDAASKATARREAAAAVAHEADSVAVEARRQSNKLKGKCSNIAKCLGASQKAAFEATEDADKLKGEYGSMAKCLDAFHKAAVQATKEATKAKHAHAEI